MHTLILLLPPYLQTLHHTSHHQRQKRNPAQHNPDGIIQAQGRRGLLVAVPHRRDRVEGEEDGIDYRQLIGRPEGVEQYREEDVGEEEKEGEEAALVDGEVAGGFLERGGVRGEGCGGCDERSEGI